MRADEPGAKVEARAAQSVDYAYASVRDAILEGSLAPGETMAQAALATELGVSRTPLREALRMLQAERLIEDQGNRRVRVAPMSVADLEGVVAARITLEAQAIRLSVPLMEQEHMARLERAIAEMEYFRREGDVGHWMVPHAAFHRLLFELAGERFVGLLELLVDHHNRYQRLHVGVRPNERTSREHRCILDAVKRGDGRQAGALLAEHLGLIAFELAERLEPERDLPALRQVLTDAGAQQVWPGSEARTSLGVGAGSGG